MAKQKQSSLIRENIAVFFALTVLFLVGVFFAFSYYVAGRVVRSYPGRIIASPILVSSDYKNVTVQGTDNAVLRGWIFNPSSKRLVIMVAGITQDRVNEGYYSLFIARDLVEKGYAVILYDSRGHGQSSGNVTLGLDESKDLIKVVNFSLSQGFKAKNIGIIGDSLGAISLIMAANNLKDVGAMVVDSPATEINVVLEEVLQRERHIPKVFNPTIFFFLKTFYNIDVNSIRPIDSIGLVPDRVFLFLHGEKDTTIPPSNSEDLLKKANKESKLVIFPNAYHVESFKVDPELYRETVYPFLDANIGK